MYFLQTTLLIVNHKTTFMEPSTGKNNRHGIFLACQPTFNSLALLAVDVGHSPPEAQGLMVRWKNVAGLVPYVVHCYGRHVKTYSGNALVEGKMGKARRRKYCYGMLQTCEDIFRECTCGGEDGEGKEKERY